jgi:hypothetical protein
MEAEMQSIGQSRALWGGKAVGLGKERDLGDKVGEGVEYNS